MRCFSCSKSIATYIVNIFIFPCSEADAPSAEKELWPDCFECSSSFFSKFFLAIGFVAQSFLFNSQSPAIRYRFAFVGLRLRLNPVD